MLEPLSAGAPRLPEAWRAGGTGPRGIHAGVERVSIRVVSTNSSQGPVCGARSHVWMALVLTLPGVGCASAPPPPTPPPTPTPPVAPHLATAMDVGFGSPLRGAARAGPQAGVELEIQPRLVRCTWSLLDGAAWEPAVAGGAELRDLLAAAPDLQPAAELLTAPGAPQPLLPADTAAQRTRFLSLGVAGLDAALESARASHALLAVATQEAALWPGSRAEFRAAGGTATVWWPLVSEPRVALGLADGTSQPTVLVLREDAWPSQGAALFVLPIEVAGLPESARIVVELELPPDGVPDEALAASQRETLDAARSVSAAASVSPSDQRAKERRMGQALAALESAETRRQALIWISRGDYPLLSELALTADDELLAELSATEAALEQPSELQGDLDQLAWRLERQAWLLCCSRALTGTASPALQSSLTVLAGQAGRYPAALSAAVRAAASSDDLQDRLVSENLTLLEESDPSSRMRAADWLERRGVLPAGFDALSPRNERRATLRAAAEAKAAAPDPTAPETEGQDR